MRMNQMVPLISERVRNVGESVLGNRKRFCYMVYELILKRQMEISSVDQEGGEEKETIVKAKKLLLD